MADRGIFAGALATLAQAKCAEGVGAAYNLQTGVAQVKRLHENLDSYLKFISEYTRPTNKASLHEDLLEYLGDLRNAFLEHAIHFSLLSKYAARHAIGLLQNDHLSEPNGCAALQEMLRDTIARTLRVTALCKGLAGREECIGSAEFGALFQAFIAKDTHSVAEPKVEAAYGDLTSGHWVKRHVHNRTGTLEVLNEAVDGFTSYASEIVRVANEEAAAARETERDLKKCCEMQADIRKSVAFARRAPEALRLLTKALQYHRLVLD